MMGWIQIYWILWKQYLLKYRLWIIFSFILAMTLGIIGQMNAQDSKEYQGIAVGVCWEDEKGKELLKKLEEEEGIFRFTGYQEEEEMIRQVKNGTLECGYFFPRSFYEDLLEGKAKRQVILYRSPASSAHKISYEVVFANLFKILSGDILTDYLRTIGYEDGKELEAAKERLLLLNEQYAKDGSTFHFVYETIGSKGDSSSENLNVFKGCMAVMMFLMCLLGLGNAMEQERTWAALPGYLGKKIRSGCIHVAVLGSILIGGITLMIAGIYSHQEAFGQEMTALFVYFLALEIYVRILNLFLKNSRTLYGLLPALILGSCLFCPVFIRLENFLPGVAWISRLFPVSYYLDI